MVSLIFHVSSRLRQNAIEAVIKKGIKYVSSIISRHKKVFSCKIKVLNVILNPEGQQIWRLTF